MKTARNISKLISLILAVSMIAVFAVGCIGNPGGGNTPEPATQAPNNNKTKDSVIRPAAGTGTMALNGYEKLYTEGLNNFTIALIEAMGDNWTGVVSPLSVSMMLQLLANGVSDETERGMILNAILPAMGIDAANQSAAKLIRLFNEIPSAETKDSKIPNSVKISLLTAILVGIDDEFAKNFEATAGDYFNASVGNIDFGDNEAALQLINKWVSDGTNGLIPNLFDEIPSDTAMAAVNALYFNANWQIPFITYRGDGADQNSGIGGFFNGVNGKTAVSMLSSSNIYRYGEFDGHQVVLVPYQGGEYYMAVVLPEESSTPAAALAGVLSSLNECADANVQLVMPSVSLDTHVDIMTVLKSLGLGSIESGDFLFPGIVENASIRLTQFEHGAVLNVTETGTEAAAASGVTGTKNAGPVQIDPDIRVICDRPYAMAIIHAETGAVLFASTVNDLA